MEFLLWGLMIQKPVSLDARMHPALEIKNSRVSTSLLKLGFHACLCPFQVPHSHSSLSHFA